MATVTDWFAEALRFHQQGHLVQATACYRQILDLEPEHADAWHLLGVISCQQGLAEAGIPSIQRAIQLRPSSPSFYSNLGNALQACNRFAEAIAALKQALGLDPDHLEALNNLGNLLLKQGSHSEAVACFKRCIQLQPDFAEAYNNLGNALAAQEHLEEAISAYQQALQVRPDYLQACYNLAQVFKKQELWDQAMACLNTCIHLNPQWAKAWNLMGHVYLEQGQIELALKAYQQSEQWGPDPGNRIRMELLLPGIFQNVAELEHWRERYSLGLDRLLTSLPDLHDPVQQVGMTPFFLAYQGKDDRDLQQKLARMYRQACPNLTYVAPHCFQPTIRPGQRKRIGFVSRFLRHHTIAKLFGGLIRELPRSEFEVWVFAVDHCQDQWASDIRQWADHEQVLPTDFFEARQVLAAVELDILFYPDIGMEPLTYFMAFARLAPLQAVSWGHPVTTGIDTVDAFFSSEFLDENQAQTFYSEQLVQMKNLIPYYHLPEAVAPKTRGYFSLSEDELVLGCLQSLFKLHPDFDPILAAILSSIENARLILLADSHAVMQHQLEQRWQAAWPAELFQKVTFLPRLAEADYLALLPLCDVMLDPIHFGGGSTSYEALAAGVPIVTMPSPYLKGRISYALLQHLGETTGIVASPAEYVAKVQDLAASTQRETLKQAICTRSRTLYENHAAVTEFATCLHSLYFHKCQPLG